MSESKLADFKPSNFSVNSDNDNNENNILNIDTAIIDTDNLSNMAITSTIDTSLIDIPCEVVKLPTLGMLRKDLGRSVEEVAGILRLSPKQVAALELQHWAALPGAAYTKGFLKNYARYLKVDVQPYIAQFEAAIVNERPIDTTEIPNQQHINPSAEIQVGTVASSKITTSTFKMTHDDAAFVPTYLIKLALGLIAVTIVFLLVWDKVLWQPKINNTVANTAATINTDDTVKDNIVPVDSNINTLPIPAPLSTNKTASLQELQASADVLTALALQAKSSKGIKNTNPNIEVNTNIGIIRNLELIIDKAVWVEVRDAENKVLAYGVKTAGSKHNLMGNAPLKIVIGATNALRLNLDGKPYDFSDKVVGNVARFAIP